MIDASMDVLIATSRDAPGELVTPVAAALAADELDVHSVDLGRVGESTSRLGRVARALLGEAEAGRLVRELATGKPRVGVAFDAGAAAALVVARDRKVSATAVVAALTDLGVDGARVTVVGPLVPRALHDAARADKAATRAEFKLPADAKVVLVDTRGLALETLAQLTLQLSLASRPIYVLFDAATSTDAAAQVRRQVPTLGIKGKLFGDTPNASKLWRCADVVLGRPTARAIHAALAIDAGFVALQPEGAHEDAEVRALVDRRLGAGVSQVLFAGNALEPLLARRTGKPPADGAGEVAELVAMVAAHHEEVLAETAAAAAERAAAAASDEPEGAGDVEDLD